MVRVVASGMAAGFFVAALAASTPSFAQSEITVYAPFRGIATPIARAGSSVSVITREEIEQAGQISVAELLRTVPGVSFTGAGGPASQKDVRIRGTEAQHTMVLIDGVPVSETTSTRNVFDFRTLSLSSVERIEVLRGPQSALYGSDAIGGVINIITRQATNGLSGSATVEGGSFGTHREILEASYGGDQFGIFANLSHSSTEGFSSRVENDEDDGQRQWSGFVRGSLQASEAVRLDAQILVSDTESEYDSSGTRPRGVQERFRVDTSARGQLSLFEDRWIQTVTLSAGLNNVTDDFDPFGAVDQRITDFEGERFGIDYTSSVDLGMYGSLLVGGNIEHQTASRDRRTDDTEDFTGDDTFWGAFAMHQFSIGQNLHLSASVRFDDFDTAGTFVTGRGTAVYEIYETETRFHASAGTGAKAPSLFQRLGTRFINPVTLLPEESFGFDAGVTQVLFDGRLTVDVTGFYNSIENMLDFFDINTANFEFDDGYYINIAQAETYGLEITADARLIPGHLDASAHYTYLVANNTVTGQRLRRRPEHEGQISLTYYGIDRLSVTGTAIFVGGDHFSSSDEDDSLDPYVRVDVTASYQAHDHLEIFGRIENLFDADYQERDGYNTAGLSAYVGLRATY